MLLIVEVLMLLGGLWTAATGKLPSWLVGGLQYTAEGPKVRLLGLWIALPLPVANLASIVLVLLFGQDARAYATIFELIAVMGVAVVAVIAFLLIGQPVAVTDMAGNIVVGEAAKLESTIAKKAQGALLYANLGGLGFTAIVTSPLAFIYATQALRLIEQHHVGQQHRNKANLARFLAVVIFLFYAGIVVCVYGLAFLGNR